MRRAGASSRGTATRSMWRGARAASATAHSCTWAGRDPAGLSQPIHHPFTFTRSWPFGRLAGWPVSPLLQRWWRLPSASPCVMHAKRDGRLVSHSCVLGACVTVCAASSHLCARRAVQARKHALQDARAQRLQARARPLLVRSVLIRCMSCGDEMLECALRTRAVCGHKGRMHACCTLVLLV